MSINPIDVIESNFGIIATTGDPYMPANERPVFFDAIFDVLRECIKAKKDGVPDSGRPYNVDFEISFMSIDADRKNLTPDELKKELEVTDPCCLASICIDNGESILSILYDARRKRFYLESLALLLSDRDKITALLVECGIISSIEKKQLDDIM